MQFQNACYPLLNINLSLNYFIKKLLVQIIYIYIGMKIIVNPIGLTFKIPWDAYFSIQTFFNSTSGSIYLY
jgi:hypothetical protein